MSTPGTPPSVDADGTDRAARLQPMHAHVSTSAYLRQMWERRSFAIAMPLEEVRTSHQNTFLGNLWHLVNPMLSVAVFYLVFGIFLGARGGIDNYVLWLMVGVFTFGLTSRSVLLGAKSITNNLGLMRAMRFPRALLPVSTVLGRVLTFGFELGVLAFVALVTEGGFSKRYVFLPLILVLHTTLNLGLAMIAARLNDSYRDVQELIPFVFQLLRYVSGVMFPVTQYIYDADAPKWVSRIVALNPMVQILDLYRWVFLGNPVDPLRTSELVVASVLLLVFGFRFFRAHELRYGRA